MKKIFNKVLAGVTTIALIASLVVGVNVSKNVNAAETEATLVPWSFFQTGTSTNAWNTWEVCAFSKVTTTTGETLNSDKFSYTPAPNGTAADEKTVSTTQTADGFTATVVSNGWSAEYPAPTHAYKSINPYCLSADMKAVPIEKGHDYTISFTAKATTNKGVYVGVTNVYGENIAGGAFTATPAGVDMAYDFTNFAESETIDISLMLGAFVAGDDGKIIDFDGTTDISNLVASEVNWGGDVTISNFKLIDKGQNPGYVPAPPKDNEVTTPAPTTVAPTTKAPTVVAPTTKAPTVKKLAKVKKLKVKNNKKGTIKITWKKVTNAKKYEIKVGKKTYTSKKATKTVKKLKKGKKYTVKVRAKAAGYTTGAWAKKTIKIKK